MKILRRGVITCAMALGLVLQATPPAHAATVGSGYAMVAISTSAGLGYTILFPPQPSVGFAITATVACAAGAAYTQPAGIPVDAGICNLAASGELHRPSCNLGSGSVSGSLSLNSATSFGKTFPFSGALFLSEGQLLITGTMTFNGEAGPFVFQATVYPLPTPGGPDCLQGNRTSWIAQGPFSYSLQ